MEIHLDQDAEYKPVMSEKTKEEFKDFILRLGMPYWVARKMFQDQGVSQKEWNIFKLECVIEKSKN